MRTPIERYFHALYPDPDWDANPEMDGTVHIILEDPRTMSDKVLAAQIKAIQGRAKNARSIN
jgi:hypothetical protein